MWVGLVQSAEGLKTKDEAPRRENAASSCNLSFSPASSLTCAAEFGDPSLRNGTSQFLKIDRIFLNT